MEPLTQEDIALFWQAYQETFYFEEEQEWFNEDYDRELNDLRAFEESN